MRDRRSRYSVRDTNESEIEAALAELELGEEEKENDILAQVIMKSDPEISMRGDRGTLPRSTAVELEEDDEEIKKINEKFDEKKKQ